ncbi:MAG: DegT/DnrJ/EryC1/StrS family aminotransferase [Planctomycetota bacterium]
MIPFSVPELTLGACARMAATLCAGRAQRRRLVEDFEARFAARLGVRHAIAMVSARRALTEVYRYAGAERGVVVTTPYTCIPAIDAIRWAGSRPLFSDIELESYSLAYNEALTKRHDVRALSLTYLYGLVADPAPLVAWARARGIFIVEDAAIALGATIHGRPAGTLGDAGIFSLQSSKILTAWRGAVVVTSDDRLAATLRTADAELPALSAAKLCANVGLLLARRACAAPFVYGASFSHARRFAQSRVGAALLGGFLSQDASEAVSGNSPAERPATDSVRFRAEQAALALPGLAALDAIIATRRAHARALRDGLADVADIALPQESPGIAHAYGRFPIRLAGVTKQTLVTELARRGVEAAAYYPYLSSETRHVTGKCEILGELPNARRAAHETTLLPMHTRLNARAIDRIIDAVRGAAEELTYPNTKTSMILSPMPVSAAPAMIPAQIGSNDRTQSV